VFEHTQLFERGVGGTTDVVQKEMYTFEDKKGRSITLKPEGTAGAARAFIEHGLSNTALPLKVYYFTPCFRYETPQSGRLREHHQFGVEYFGTAAPSADAEVIALAKDVLNKFGIADLTLKINSVGCPDCREKYKTALREFFKPKFDELCGLCKDRFERNPLRLLDCKIPSCKPLSEGAPIITDYLCDDCKTHFDGVKNYLTVLGIPYTPDPYIVRGLDYYTGTVFEFVPQREGGQTTICGGGRYNGLITELGGGDVPALGFGMGLERVIMELTARGINPAVPNKPKVYIAPLTGQENAAVKLTAELRAVGVSALTDITGRGLKAQMKYADKTGAEWVVAIGDREITENAAELKNMRDKEQTRTVALDARTIADVVG
jgi:histidyl-tRNA synthetase